MKNSLSNLINTLLSQNNIIIDKEELTFQIQSHPSYPSLHAITGVLDHFNIDNLALDVSINEATLSQLPKTFLAQLKTEQGNTFAVVINKGLNYEVLFSKKEKKQLSINEFLKQFTGILVAVEKTEDIIISNKKSNLSSKVFVAILALITIGFFLNNTINVIHILYMLISSVGIYISSAIIKQELGEKTILGEAFCSSSNTKTNCNAVLNSKGSHIGNYKLSDVSIIYFTGLTLTSILLLISGNPLTLPLTINLLAIPITLYSIYYQYAVVKQWCTLCLSVVGVLWIQAGVSFFYLDFLKESLSSITINELLITAFSFISSFIIWNVLSPNIKLIKELKASKITYFKFKRDFTLFEALLNTSKTIDTSIENTSEIVFGNKASNLNITIVTSPFCGHCKAVHTLIEDILKKYNELLQITIRFNANSKNTTLIDVTSRLLEIYHTQGEDQCMEAMHDIYGDLNVDTWKDKWGTNDRTTYEKTLENEYQWCIANGINFTPEILINGKSYPKAYDRGDLIYFIEDLEENCCINSENTVENLEITT